MNERPEAPVLLIIFNRPDTTEKVFEAIRRAKPKKLFVSADAPRAGSQEDGVNCDKSREIVRKVDWECETHYRFLDENVGCGWGPATAITWAFEHEDRLIILEDDCVPSMSFFPYCNQLLDKYLNDTRIWLVSGRSHQSNSRFFDQQDYIFSHYGHSWGWGTWKRCWEQFDMHMTDLSHFIKIGGALNVLSSKEEGLLFNKKYSKLFADKNLHTHVWDFQFGYAILKNGGLCVVPAKNLIENIGYVGTHSTKINEFTSMKAEENFKVERHPRFVAANREYEKLHFDTHIRKIMGDIPLMQRILRKIKKIAG
jgi:hypothetical protein